MDESLIIPAMADAEIVKIKDLPEILIAAIHQDIREYTIAFVDHRENDHAWIPSLLGSGVLVSTGGVKAILTAAHVVDTLRRDQRLCVLLEKTTQPHSIDFQALTLLRIAKGKTDEDGPDLGAVILAPSVAGSIAGKRLFYDLDAHRGDVFDNPKDLN